MLTSSPLGRLERVDLRTVWESEAGNFTPWLAQAENIELLGNAIGLDLEVEAQEKFVGPFRADILCKDTFGEAWVLVENQLEKTDHTHLGQLLTYAAGLDAVTIVWIAKEFTDEHRAALDWLNTITDQRFNFFGLELEVWQIGDSSCAPKFNVISHPNDFTRSVRRGAHAIDDGTLTETGRMRIAYWTAFTKLLDEHAPHIRYQKVADRYVLPINVGKSGFSIVAMANFKHQWIGVELRCERDDRKASFRWIQSKQDEVENELDTSLEWKEVPNPNRPDQKRSVIRLRQTDFNPAQQDQWPEQHDWLLKWTVAFHRTFTHLLQSPELNNLDAFDFDNDETGDDEDS